MAHALEPSAGSLPDIGEPYRLRARMRKTWDDPVVAAKSVGRELREERERTRKQLNDVSRALKIRASYLAAIEEGRFEDLPGHVFTIGYVGRYARYLALDVESLQQRLEAEIAAHDGNFSRVVDIEVLPDRKLPVLGIACAALLVAALIYARDDVVSLATRTFDQAAVLAHDVLDTAAPAVEPQSQVATSESSDSLAFEVETAQPVSLRAEPLPPLPSIAVTQPRSIRPDLLPPLPMIAVTQSRTVRFDLLPPLPAIAVTEPRAVRFDLLPALPMITVTQPQSVRFDLLPPLPMIAVTEPRDVRFDLLPPLPMIAVTEPRDVRFDLLPPPPIIAVTQPISLRADLMPAPTPARAGAQLLPMPVPPRIDVTSRASLRTELLPQNVQLQLPRGTRYGVQNRTSRITLRVHAPTIVAVRDGRNRVFIDRTLAPGDTYRVPNRAGLWLTAIDAGAVEILLDGSSVGFAGAQGAAVRDLSLNPQRFGAAETRTSSRSGARPVRAAPNRSTPNRATGKSRFRTRTNR
jgi:hypothetical protein